MVYYTARTDFMNHAFSKSHFVNYFEYYRTQLLLYKLKWNIYYKKDYVLIISSDHGGQKYLGDDNFSNHGFLTDEN